MKCLSCDKMKSVYFKNSGIISKEVHCEALGFKLGYDQNIKDPENYGMKWDKKPYECDCFVFVSNQTSESEVKLQEVIKEVFVSDEPARNPFM